ncbi:MAG TPA: Gfo/Idh/MocA family oxidoreductase [Verrucomicrobiae bacterium]|nr:Gfo/Idh/MocA family oxidoreductase [Verrucomicrobiae bacterium]
MSKISRRTFLRRAGITVGSTFFIPRFGLAQSPNEKLNIGIVGTANQARFSINNVKSENIVAVCDIDDNFLAKAVQDFPSAKKYNDFRKLLEQKNIDAVVVAIPDHAHAVATVAALKSGHHVYCEKPLTHTVSECREVQKTAEHARKATQIGTQIHAGDNYRRVVELIQRDAIGPVKEVHVWVSAVYGGKKRPTDTPPVPPTIHYDLWLGPAEYRPYSPEYLPFVWRNWWAFGGGTMADFGCHYMDLPHWALGLHAPLSVEAVGPERDPECPPVWMIAHFEYANPKGGDPIKLTWYQGGKQPDFLEPEIAQKWKSGVLFIGEKGQLLSDYGRHMLLPQEKFRDFAHPEPFIPKSIGHHKEWIQACKTGSPTTCNFGYSGTLTEAALLGNVAFRVGKKIEWDSKNLKAKNCPEADEFIQHHYRQGWKL